MNFNKITEADIESLIEILDSDRVTLKGRYY